MMKKRILQAVLSGFVLLAMVLPVMAHAADDAEQAAIRSLMMSTWDKPSARLEAGPIVIQGDRAVAGWTQDGRGGRALLARSAAGQWQVTACAGDGLRDAKTLEQTGMSATAARQLAQAVARAESAVAPQRRALFSTFDGTLRMGGAEGHPAHEHGTKR